MNRRSMDLNILFNKTVEECRAAGAIGGRRAARNRRLRKASQVPATPEANQPHQETMREARQRLDESCPWLRGVEVRSRKRRPA